MFCPYCGSEDTEMTDIKFQAFELENDDYPNMSEPIDIDHYICLECDKSFIQFPRY